MSSSNEKLNPRANIYLMVNLGCEMLYVIDQRLKAQKVPLDRSKQIIYDVTGVLLETKFLKSLIIGSTQPTSQIFSENHCKFMLNDIASSSLMRLNGKSMEKLWNLITMNYKWQLFLTEQPHHLLDITMQHLKSIGDLYNDRQNLLLIDIAKNIILDFWNTCTSEQHISIYETLKLWLANFNVKISLLVRLGFQTLDGNFLKEIPHAYFYEYCKNLGENIYEKSLEITERIKNDKMKGNNNYVQQLADVLDIRTITTTTTVATTIAPTTITSTAWDSSLLASVSLSSSIEHLSEFVPVETKYYNTNIDENV